MTASFLPYGRQSIDEADIAAVVEVLRSPWLTQGPVVEQFEAALAAKTGAQHAVACSNGTTALHLAAAALDLGPGDAVAVPSVTFLATANAVRYVGAEVVFADVDPDTGLMRQDDLRAAIQRATAAGLRPRAVFPVHLAGQPTDAADAAAELGLDVVEDAAHALGSRHTSVPVGGCPNGGMTTFSFHPVKTIATGEGGAVTTEDAGLAARLRSLRSHGMSRDGLTRAHLAADAEGRPNPWYYEMREVGYNYRLTDLQSALGLSQLERLEAFANARRALVARYDAALAPLAPVVRPLARTANADAVAWHLYVALIDFERLGRSRAEVMQALSAQGIGTQVHYIPVHTQPYYVQRYGEQTLPGAEVYYDRCLSLPLFPGLGAEGVDRVVGALAELVTT